MQLTRTRLLPTSRPALRSHTISRGIARACCGLALSATLAGCQSSSRTAQADRPTVNIGALSERVATPTNTLSIDLMQRHKETMLQWQKDEANKLVATMQAHLAASIHALHDTEARAFADSIRVKVNDNAMRTVLENKAVTIASREPDASPEEKAAAATFAANLSLFNLRYARERADEWESLSDESIRVNKSLTRLLKASYERHQQLLVDARREYEITMDGITAELAQPIDPAQQRTQVQRMDEAETNLRASFRNVRNRMLSELERVAEGELNVTTYSFSQPPLTSSGDPTRISNTERSAPTPSD